MDLSGLSTNLPSTTPSTAALRAPVSASSAGIKQTSLEELNNDLTNEFKNAAKSIASLYNSTSNNNANSDIGDATAAAAAAAKGDFSNAAKAVTGLYRLTNNGLSLVRKRGYLDCLDDLVQVLTNGEDLENWILAKRAEMNHTNNQVNTTSTTITTTAAATSTAASSTSSYPTNPSHAGTATSSAPYMNSAADAVDNAGTVDAVGDFHIPLDYSFSISSSLALPHAFRPLFPPLSVLHSAKQRANMKYRRDRQLTKKLLQHSNNSHFPSQSLEDMMTSDDEIDELDDESVKRRKLDRK